MIKKEVEEKVMNSVNQGKIYSQKLKDGFHLFVKSVGRLTDDPGLIYEPGASGGWRRPATADEASRVSRPGTFRKFMADLW